MPRKLRALAVVYALSSFALAQDAKQDEKKPDEKQEEKKDDSTKKQDQPKKEKEIIVTATRTEEEAANLPQSTTTVTPDEIRKRQPTQPIDAVRDEPGVWIQQTGSGGGSPILRGQIGNRVLYLVDGIRINNGASFSGPNGFFNQIDMGSIDQVDILKGPGSVQYGSDAIGGILHFRTKKIDKFPKEFEMGGRVTGHYSTVDEGKYGHLELYAAQDRFNVLIGGTYLGTDDYQGGKDQGTLENTSLNALGWMMKARYKVAEGHVLTLGYLEDRRTDVERFDQSKRNQPSGIPRFFAPLADRRITYLRDEIENVTPWLSKLEPYIFVQEFESESDFTIETSTQIRRDRTSGDQNMYGGGIQGVTKASDVLKFVYGFDLRFDDLRDHKTRFTTTKATGVVTESKTAGQTPDGRYDVIDVFALADWTPIERLRITAGLRFETSHLESDPDPIDASAGFAVDDLDLDERWNAVTYSIGGIYWLWDDFGIAANVATGFRAPTYADTLSFGPFTFGVSTPSPNVDPEESLTYEIGPRFEADRIAFQVTWHHTFLRDVLTSEPTGGFVDLNGSGTQDAGEAAFARTNSGKGWIRGIEASGEWRFLDDLSVFGSLAYTVGWNEDKDEPLRFIPPVHGTLGLRYRAGEKKIWVEGFARLVRHHTRISDDDKTDPARAEDPSRTFPSTTNPPLRDDFSVPGYTTYHMRLGIPISETATILLCGDNLSNKKYRETFSRQDAPGISFTIGAEIKF